MSSVNEIKTKIASVENTQKITKAMEMVAASKMRKTQDKMFASRPYAEAIIRVISHLSKENTGVNHPFLQEREVKKVGFLVISTDRGLCGGLNVNLFKQVLKTIEEKNEAKIKITLGLLGSKAVSFFNRFKFDVIAQTTGIGDNFSLTELLGSINVMIKEYKAGKIDEIYIACNRFVNTMSQKPICHRMLPATHLDLVIKNLKKDKIGSDYIYEADAEKLLDKLLVRYVESLVYQAVLENSASEQAARMVAMKSATDNALSLIDDLRLVYNKVRQTNITNELNEIVAGAAAI